MEHRWGVRRPTHVRVRIFGRSSEIATGWLRDLSLTGTFVRTSLIAPVMSTVRVVPHHLSPAELRPRELFAYVVRIGTGGLGLEWWDIAPESLRRLKPGTTPTLQSLVPAPSSVFAAPPAERERTMLGR